MQPDFFRDEFVNSIKRSIYIGAAINAVCAVAGCAVVGTIYRKVFG